MKKAYKHTLVAIDEITPYDGNARTHSEEQINQIAESIREWGFTNPVLVDENKLLIAGHGRLAGAKVLGMTTIPAIIVDGLTIDQKRALILADNQIALNAGWDLDKLQLELSALKQLNFDISKMGFSKSDLDGIFSGHKTSGLTDDDAVPEIPVIPVSQVMDVWLLGKHRVMCGDSTKIENLEELMGDDKADLVHTDPPYNVDYSNQDRPKPGKKDHGRIENDKMGQKEFRDFLKSIMKIADKFSKDDCAFYVWYASIETLAFFLSFEDTSISIAQQIIWKKPMLLGRSRYQWAHEPCIFAVKGSPFHINDRKKTTVWDFGGYDKSNNVHPTQKPIFLPVEAITNSSKPEGIVLDLFGGSGSTLIACQKTDRHARLMELDGRYVDVIVKRWEDFTGQTAIHERTGKSFANTATDRKALS